MEHQKNETGKDGTIEFKKPKMWRKRYIPYEIVDISNDEVIYRDDNLIVTTWNVIHPRADFQKGISYIYLDKGIKIIKQYKANGEFVKYYCDIFELEYSVKNDEYVFTDLLLDVIIYPDNEVRILDADELAQALEDGLITKEQAADSLRKLNELLSMIYSGNFPPKEVLE